MRAFVIDSGTAAIAGRWDYKSAEPQPFVRLVGVNMNALVCGVDALIELSLAVKFALEAEGLTEPAKPLP